MDKPKCWVKNVKKQKTNYSCRIWVETTQHFLEFIDPNIHELKNDL